MRLVSFGAPRLGNAALVARFRGIQTARFVNLGDPVPHVPPHVLHPLGFCHTCATTCLNPLAEAEGGDAAAEEELRSGLKGSEEVAATGCLDLVGPETDVAGSTWCGEGTVREKYRQSR